MSTERLEKLEAQVGALQFALSRLWLKEFERHPNPLEVAETYAQDLNAVYPSDGPPEFAETREMLLGFFEQLVAELRIETGGDLPH